MENGEVNYLDSSNNGDLVKVFGTVVGCINIFVTYFPECVLYFQGNTAQKTRIYQEILRRHYDEFSKKFNIFGMPIKDGISDSVFEEFDSNKKYSGFSLELKK